jgi:predicted  nucleic acid-binding Zn-ribbon protein
VGVLKKIVAVIVMVISALLLVFFLGGIVGSWIVRNDAIRVVGDFVTLADHSLQRAQTGLGQVRTEVGDLQTKLDSAVTGLEAAGAKLEQTNVALVAAETLLDKDLTPGVQRLQDQVSDVRDRVAVIDDTLNVMKVLPFTRQNPLVNDAVALIERLKTFDQNFQETRQAIQGAKSQATQEAVAAVTAPLKRASAAAASVNERLGELDSRLGAAQVELTRLQQDFNSLATLLAVIGTLACFWLAFAQLGLFVHALGVFTGRDPLARWHRAQAPDKA